MPHQLVEHEGNPLLPRVLFIVGKAAAHLHVLWSRERFMSAGGVYAQEERVKRVKSIVILNEVAEKKERSGYAGSEREAVW